MTSLLILLSPDEHVRERMAATQAPGVAYAVVSARDVVHTGTFGTDGDGKPVTASTPFLWGSVSKPVTATLAMTLAKSGELRLDAPVVSYLPAFRLKEPGAERITVRQLLNQTSGIPTSLTLTDQFDPGRRPLATIPDFATISAVSEPGAEHHYSSLNYLALSAVIEQVTGKPFADVLRTRLLEPLGMKGAITAPSDRLPPGHRYVFGQPVAMDSPYDAAGVGYGYLGGTLQDAIAFAQAQLGAAPKVLDSDLLTELHRGETPAGEGLEYGLGWRRWPLKNFGVDSDQPVVWHGGAVAGYQAAIMLLPSQDRAVVVLQNAYGTFQEPQLLDTAFGLTTLLAGGEPTPSKASISYPAALAGFVALALLLVVLLAFSIQRAIHPRRPRRLWRLALSLLLLGGLATILAWFLPRALGLELDQLVLWAPDLAWLVNTILGLIVLLAAAQVVLTARQRQVRPRTTDAGARLTGQ
ncbi:serine hydrolase domain-containing protein [Kribbella italica]|uniref:CubicO group peptidase (Beta-lactamase class C family) n=1 Tax=Kribbella italica TaxID=1540520 RepID=A0A7W9MV99_9ACTN|nr:serine hydrolase domain-containing protein [Kribbella italica]MBB5837706.1 CubicO group peptidase (beta-lactamase class C family) [Kribbella italica]